MLATVCSSNFNSVITILFLLHVQLYNTNNIIIIYNLPSPSIDFSSVSMALKLGRFC